MNIRFDEDPFAKNAQAISKIYHEVLMLMKFSETKPQVKNVNINYYVLSSLFLKIEKKKVMKKSKKEL